MATTQRVLDQLNAYDAETARLVRDATDDDARMSVRGSRDPWNAVILQLDEYDELATTELNGHQASDRFVLTNGVVIRYDATFARWYEHP